jgi:hypothetical protein
MGSFMVRGSLCRSARVRSDSPQQGLATEEHSFGGSAPAEPSLKQSLAADYFPALHESLSDTARLNTGFSRV